MVTDLQFALPLLLFRSVFIAIRSPLALTDQLERAATASHSRAPEIATTTTRGTGHTRTQTEPGQPQYRIPRINQGRYGTVVDTNFFLKNDYVSTHGAGHSNRI